MYSYMARQPIFSKDQSVFGYELLFRDGVQACFPNADSCAATSSVLSQSFLTVDLEQMFQRKKLFINFPENLLLNRTPLLFPPEQLIVEVLETVSVTEALVEALKEFDAKGYVLALDDFVDGPEYKRLFPYVGILKIDIRQTPLDRILRLKESVASYPIRLLAEKVETIEEYHQTRDLGFEYFQGYYF